MSVTQYLTKQGDRWDNIAYQAYGDATRYMQIIQANKPLAIEEELPAGIKINIPILEEDQSPPLDLLPPWKRAENSEL